MHRPRLSTAQLQRYIQEAYTAWWEEQQKFKNKFPNVTVPLNRGFQWPYQPTTDLITPIVDAKVGRLNETMERMIWRLKRIRYPYPENEYKESTGSFYQYVIRNDLLGGVLSSWLLGQIWMTWFLQGYYLHELALHKKKMSQYGYPLRFHRDAMKQIAGHLLGLETLAHDNEVPAKWFANYRSDALRALLREASICYPQMLMGFKSAAQFRPDRSAGETQRDLFGVIQTAFSGKSISANFAYHLIALICSRSSSIKQGKLNPIPTGVGKNIRKKTKKQVGKSSKKPA